MPTQHLTCIICLLPTNQPFLNIQLHLVSPTFTSFPTVCLNFCSSLYLESFLYLISICQSITYLSRLTRNATYFFIHFLIFSTSYDSLKPQGMVYLLYCAFVWFWLTLKLSRNFAFMAGILSYSSLSSPKDLPPGVILTRHLQNMQLNNKWVGNCEIWFISFG